MITSQSLKLSFALYIVGICGVGFSFSVDLGIALASEDNRIQVSRETKMLWTDSAIAQLTGALTRLSDHGLDPDDYFVGDLRRLRDDRVQRDLLATTAWFKAAKHLSDGKLNPQTYAPEWNVPRRNNHLVAVLKTAIESDTVDQSLQSLAPKHPEYSALVAELVRLKAHGNHPITRLSFTRLLERDTSGADVRVLQIRLNELKLFSDNYISENFDLKTERAVRLFQQLSGIEVDGIVGPITRARLNRGTEEKIDQLRVNLERWRWLPDEFGQKHLRANIAEFRVSAYNKGVREQSHLIIVGRDLRETPVFSDMIEYVVLNPWWETPLSIARKDELPLFQKDPTAVTRLGFQILDSKRRVIPADSIDWSTITPESFSYQLRQAPGPLNALGRIKIMFPNRHSIYLHDTPAVSLFEYSRRAFSSGCLRIQYPFKLAEWLFSDTPEWTKERFEEIVATGEETRVNLVQPVAIYILYLTSTVDDSGRIRFLDDVYGRDKAILADLKNS